MNKKLSLILGSMVLVICIGLTVSSIQNQHFSISKMFTPKPTPHERQLAYLKKHEQEIIDFVKSQNTRVDSVQIDWEQTKWSESGLIKAGEYIIVVGEVNNIDNSSWGVELPITNDGSVDMDGIFLGNEIRVGGDLL